jgi:hypothetical protein
MKFICIAVVAMICTYTKNNRLTGTWQRLTPSGGVHRITFTADNTFQMSVNDQPRVSGTYTLRDSIFTIEDFGCPDMTGTYKISFFGGDDSCRFQAISDPCDGRVQQANDAVLFRIK